LKQETSYKRRKRRLRFCAAYKAVLFLSKSQGNMRFLTNIPSECRTSVSLCLIEEV